MGYYCCVCYVVCYKVMRAWVMLVPWPLFCQLISQVSASEGDELELIVQGLCAFLLGICVIFNVDQVPSYHKSAVLLFIIWLCFACFMIVAYWMTWPLWTLLYGASTRVVVLEISWDSVFKIVVLVFRYCFVAVPFTAYTLLFIFINAYCTFLVTLCAPFFTLSDLSLKMSRLSTNGRRKYAEILKWNK